MAFPDAHTALVEDAKDRLATLQLSCQRVPQASSWAQQGFPRQPHVCEIHHERQSCP